ncbi:hypothetical protein MASR2M78_09490 [Treponema sp.]
MDTSLSYPAALSEALDKRHTYLNQTQMPKLKEEFRIFQSAFTGFYTVLLKKGVLHEDPYKNDVKISEIEVPAERPFSESEKIDEMSIRLSNFESQIDFLVNFYQYSVDFFTLERIKRVMALIKYFQWTQLSPNSQYTNTRTLSEVIAILKSGNDPLSIGLIADSLQHLDRSSKSVFKLLKEISDYHRENYKLELRVRFLDALRFDAHTVLARKDESIKLIKRKFAEAMGDRPFYPELIEEILMEDYSGEGNSLREDLLKRLAFVQEKPKEEKQTISFRSILIDGLRSLGSLSYMLDDVIRKLNENSDLLESSKNGFFDKVRRLIRQMMNKADEERFYELEYVDTILGTKKRVSVNFVSFKNELERKSKFLAAISNKNTTSFKRLETATEEQIVSVLTKNLEEMQSLHKTMSAFDVFFKTEAGRAEIDKIAGIKPELSSIKNGIIKANQKRHEYTAQKKNWNKWHVLASVATLSPEKRKEHQYVFAQISQLCCSSHNTPPPDSCLRFPIRGC